MQNKELEKAIKELAAREVEFIAAITDLPIKKHDYKIKNAIAYRKAEGSIPEREHQALLACEKEHLAYLTAEARADVAKVKLYDCKAVIDARRSLMSFEKLELEMSGIDDTT